MTHEPSASPAAGTSQLASAVPPVFAIWSWVPIRSLAARHRERIAAHLTQLGEHDRYLRFGYPATDAQIGNYVDMLDFERDEVFGIFNRGLHLARGLMGDLLPVSKAT